MKKGIVLLIAILFAIAGVVSAGQIATTYTESSRYHGLEVYDQGYLNLGVATELDKLNIAAMSHIGNEIEDLEYWDTQLSYSLTKGEGLDIDIGSGYYITPFCDIWELNLTLALPGTLSPRYKITHAQPDNSSAGQFHTFGADLYIVDSEAWAAVLTADITYDDGVAIRGDGFSDWTHTLVGANAIIPITEGMSINPACYWQHTFREEVSEHEDEFWLAASVILKF